MLKEEKPNNTAVHVRKMEKSKTETIENNITYK